MPDRLSEERQPHAKQPEEEKRRNNMKRFLASISIGVLIGSLVVLALPSPASAWNLTATPFVFVGTREECAPSPPRSRIVAAEWMWGLGLPDNGGGNTTNTVNITNPDTKDDPHMGLLLSK